MAYYDPRPGLPGRGFSFICCKLVLMPVIVFVVSTSVIFLIPLEFERASYGTKNAERSTEDLVK